MKHYYDQVMGTTGVAVAGALITVRVKNSTPGTGALASIFSDDGITSISGSTVTSDATGTFSFYAPDGRYDFVVAIAGFTKIVPDIEISDITEANSGDSPATFTSLVTSGAATLNSLTVTNNALVSGNLTVSGTITGGSGGVTASGTTNTIAKFTGTSALGNSSITDSGTLVTISQPASLKNQQNKSILYVDQYASWAAALADLPSVGGTLDGRSPSTPTALGTIDVGSTAAVTILLGPMTYTLDHFILRSGLTVIGMGVEDIQGTQIQAVGTSNQSPFILPTSASPQSIQGVHISDFSLKATVGNTAQDGFFFDVSVGNLPAGSNLESSKFSQITFQNFKGAAIHLKGRIDTPSSVIQFNDFELINIIIPTGNTTIGSALRVEGTVAQNIFWNPAFGQTVVSGTTLVYLGVTNTSDTSGPYSNWFYGATIQGGDIGVLVNGCQACTFRDSHAEADKILFQVKTPTTWHNNKLLLDGGVANGNVGTNSGAGRIIDASDTSNNFGTTVEFSHWALEGTPDKIASGVVAASAVVMRDNTFDQTTPAMSTTGCFPGYSTSTTTFNFQNSPSAFVNGCSGGTVTTLTSGLGTNEILSLFFNASCTFAVGGNIILGGYPGTLAFNAGEWAQFKNSDQSGSNQWNLINTTAARANGFFSSAGRTTALSSTPIYVTGAADTLYLFTLHAACKTTVAAATVTPSVSYTDPSGTVQTATLGAATCTTLGAASQTVATTGLQIKAATNVNISATISGSPNYDIRSGVIKLGGN